MTQAHTTPPPPSQPRIDPELRAAFVQEQRDVLAALRESLGRLKQAPAEAHEQTHAELSVLAHRVKGSAALYGHPQLSALAGLMERLLNSRPNLGGEDQATYHELLDLITEGLDTGVSALETGGSDLQLGLHFARQGGPELMNRLLTARPDAFALRFHPHAHDHAEEEGETGSDESAGLEAELRAFRLENDEVWEYFAPEVREHLGLLRAELERGEEGDLNVMFRAAHTIKGSSYMVGLQVLGDHAHRAEDLLGAVRDDALALSAPVRAALQDALDDLEDVLAVAEGAPVEVGARLERSSARMQALLAGEPEPVLSAPVPAAGAAQTPATGAGASPDAPAPAVDTALATIRVTAAQLETLLEQVGSLVAARARTTQTLGLMHELQEAMQDSQARFQRTVREFEERYLNPDMVRADTPAGGGPGTAAPEAAGHAQAGFAELEFDTYTDLNILSRSVTELSADFSEIRKRLSGAVSDLREQHESSGKLLRELRVNLGRTSRVPFVNATTRLRRWARSHAHRLDLEVVGGEVLVESTIAQRLSEPLMHLLTNAAFHGLETPEARVLAGKAARGTIRIAAREEGHVLEVSVSDDGAGIDLARVRERTLERGLRSGQELAAMPREEQLRLILLPGLSTAESVDTATGRGVGMDVVANSVRQLGGELLIQSEAGLGTTFTLRLPATQRIADLLLVQLTSGEHPQRAALPVSGVETLLETSADALLISESGYTVRLGERDVPVVDLRQMWGESGDDLGDTASLAVMTTASGLVALRVHAFEQIEELALGRAGGALGQLGYVAGLAVSVGGQAVAVLDPAGLQRLGRQPEAWLSAETLARPARERRVLLVDDSLSVRRLVGRMLERGGWRVETANDGQEALERLQLGAQFDAVVTDLEMPRMNGYELLSALRARPATAGLPLLVMTTRAGEKHQALAFELGASDYFTKPVNEALLLRRLEAAATGVSA